MLCVVPGAAGAGVEVQRVAEPKLDAVMGDVEYRRSKAEATPVMPSSPGAVHEIVTLFQLSARAPVASPIRPVRTSESDTRCSLIDPPFRPWPLPPGRGSRARAAGSVPLEIPLSRAEVGARRRGNAMDSTAFRRRDGKD